jgi:hypothetical protein
MAAKVADKQGEAQHRDARTIVNGKRRVMETKVWIRKKSSLIAGR